jgi:hypothetical protein
MALLDKLIKALDRIPLWKRLRKLPSEIDSLTRRIREELPSELEDLKWRVSSEIPSELDTLKRRVGEEISSELSALRKCVNEEIPSQLDALKRRVSELEEKLGDKWPADVCRHCGERGLRLAHAIPVPDSQGYMRENWQCEKCGKYDVKAYIPRSC